MTWQEISTNEAGLSHCWYKMSPRKLNVKQMKYAKSRAPWIKHTLTHTKRRTTRGGGGAHLKSTVLRGMKGLNCYAICTKLLLRLFFFLLHYAFSRRHLPNILLFLPMSDYACFNGVRALGRNGIKKCTSFPVTTSRDRCTGCFLRLRLASFQGSAGPVGKPQENREIKWLNK